MIVTRVVPVRATNGEEHARDRILALSRKDLSVARPRGRDTQILRGASGSFGGNTARSPSRVGQDVALSSRSKRSTSRNCTRMRPVARKAIASRSSNATRVDNNHSSASLYGAHTFKDSS